MPSSGDDGGNSSSSGNNKKNCWSKWKIKVSNIPRGMYWSSTEMMAPYTFERMEMGKKQIFMLEKEQQQQFVEEE
jgi:hypothetical protein